MRLRQDAIQKQEDEEKKAKADADAESEENEGGVSFFGLKARTLINQFEKLFDIPAIAPYKGMAQPLFDRLEENEALIFAVVAIPGLMLALPFLYARIPKVRPR